MECNPGLSVDIPGPVTRSSSPPALDDKQGHSQVNMVVADVDDGHTNGIMTDHQQCLVVVLDESCCERRFEKKAQENGLPQIDDPVEGVLSVQDINLLLSMFDTGCHFLAWTLTDSHHNPIADKLSRAARPQSHCRGPASHNIPSTPVAAVNISGNHTVTRTDTTTDSLR